MAAKKKITLDSVQTAIDRVRKQIEALRGRVDPAERGVLDDKLAQIRTLAKTTAGLCTRTWGVWPEAKRKTTSRKGTRRRRK
jgi:hypothetical protein